MSQSLGWWVLATAAVAAALSAQSSRPTFEVTSIKQVAAPPTPGRGGGPAPDAFRRLGPVTGLIQYAYNIRPFQLFGGPEWIHQDRYEVNAKAASAASDQDMRLMVQSLLEDRFKLIVRKEQREMPVQTLLLARSDGRIGSGLLKCEDPQNPPPAKPMRIPVGALPFTGRCAGVAAIASGLSTTLGSPVIDKTGITGLWAWSLVFAQLQPLPPGPARDRADQDPTPSLTTALRDELGLKLESGRGMVDVIVIESVARPEEN